MSIFNNFEDFERICYLCCTSTDAAIKRQNELIVYQYVLQMPLNDFDQILNRASQTSLFVISEYLSKTLTDRTNLKPLFQLMIRKLIGWYNESGKFIRNNQIMQGYVYRTYTKVVGQLMKKLYLQQDSKSQLIKEIESHPKEFLLYQWKYFIQIVNIIDTQIGFLCYRNLTYMFQDDLIPKIVETLIPYFNKLTQKVRFCELANLQENLSVNQFDSSRQNYKKMLIFSSQELRIADLVMQLLQLVVNFTYNITYSQYDMDNSYDNCAISFPEEVGKKFLEGDFYESLFFLTERFLIEQPQNKILVNCFKCLQKIVLCRMTYAPKPLKHKFIQRSIIGITRLMKLTTDIKIFGELVDFNLKMLNNIYLKKFRKYEPHFTEWFEILQKKIIEVIVSTEIKFENYILKDCLELVNKIVSYSTAPKLKAYINYVKGFSQRILEKFLEKHFSNNINITKNLTMRKAKQIKKLGEMFFNPLKALISINYELNSKLLTNLQNLIYQNFNNKLNNYGDVTNFHLLVVELIQNNFFDKNIYYETPQEAAINNFGKIIGKSVQFTIFYNQNKQIDYPALEIALLILNQKILVQSLLNLDVLTSQTSVSKLISNNKIFNLTQITPKNQSIQEFLLFEFRYILNQLKTKDPKRIEYALEILCTSISKLKWGIKRDFFKQMLLNKSILDYCLLIAKSDALTDQFVKCRIGLFKTITILGFDDSLDPYKQKLDLVFEQLKLQQNPVQILIYDLRGIASQIDTAEIYRHFLEKITPLVKKLIEKVFQEERNNLVVLKNLLKLIKSMLENKSQRLNRQKIAPTIYNLVTYFISCWAILFEELNRNQVHNIEIEIPISLQLFRSFNQIMKGGYINFYLLMVQNKPDFERYFIGFMRYTVSIKVFIFQYPKLLEIYLLCVHQITRDLSEFIFTINIDVLIDLYLLLYFNMVDIFVSITREYLSGNKKYENNIFRVSEILLGTLNYIKTGSQKIHKKINHANIIKFKQKQYLKHQQCVIQIFELGLLALKNNTIMNTISKLLFALVKIFPESAMNVNIKFTQQFGDKNKSQLLQAIYTKSEKDFDCEVFTPTVTEWLRQFQNEKAVFVENTQY